MSSTRKDARWMLAMDAATLRGKDLFDLPYGECQALLETAQATLDANTDPEVEEMLAERWREEQ